MLAGCRYKHDHNIRFLTHTHTHTREKHVSIGPNIHGTNLFTVSRFNVKTTTVAAVVRTATVVVFVVAVAVSLVLCAAARGRARSGFVIWIQTLALVAGFGFEKSKYHSL